MPRAALDLGDAVTALGDGADLFARGAFRLVLGDEARQRIRISSGRIVSSAIVLSSRA